MIFFKIGFFIFIKKLLNRLYFRNLTGSLRMSPNFIIIGAARCGTTSLYNCLIKHPYIGSALRKEIHFFDSNFHNGFNWYKSFFPFKFRKLVIKYIFRHNFITGESTPFYMLHPGVPKRVFSLLPKLKIIIILRNPTDRIYSHYNKYKKIQIKKGSKILSFKEIIKRSEDKLIEGLYRIKLDEKYNRRILQKYSHLAWGIYVDQIKRWRKYYPMEQILILKSEDFFSNPSNTLKKVFKFLNLPNWEIKNFEIFEAGDYQKMDDNTREFLNNFYEPYNQQLYKYLDLNFNWK